MKELVWVALKDIPQDAELGADVEDDKGRVLMRAGTLLSESKRELLGRRGIPQLQIFAEQVMTDHEIESLRLAIEERLEQRFRQVGDQPLMQRLRAEVVRFRLGVLR